MRRDGWHAAGNWLRRTVVQHGPTGWRRALLVDLLLREAYAGSARQALVNLFEVEEVLNSLLDQKAIEYDAGIHAKHRLMGYHDFFVDRVTEEEHVLDIGCGVGAVAYDIAAKAGAWVVGMDMDADLIAFARRRFIHPRLSFVVGDALKDLPDRAFDVVVLSNVLEHIEERAAFLRRVVGVVEPRRCLIRVPMINRDWKAPLRRELGLPYFLDKTHYTEYTVDTFRAEVSQAGLSVRFLSTQWNEIWAEVVPHAQD